MPDIDRRILIAVPIVVIVVFLAGVLIGRGTAGTVEMVPGGDTVTTASSGTGDQDDATVTTTAQVGSTPTTTFVTGDPSVVLPPPPTAPGDIPQYGTEQDRSALIAVLIDAGVAGGSTADILATADYVCYTLERLRAQGRSLSFAVRVVWNDSLADLAPEDLSAFGTVLSAAPLYLCPENAEFGERISYWLGY